MANNILYISDGDYGSPAGYILPLVQGQYGQSIPLEIRDLAGNVASLTGYSTITGHKRKGGSVTAIAGTLTLSGTPTVAPQITWTVAEADTGDYGTFALFFEITNGTITYTTHPVNLTITRDPAVNATAAAGLVGVTTAQKALLAVISGLTGLVEMASGSATGVAIQTFMRTFLTSATALAARANLLPSYTSNANKVLAVNSGATDVEWVAQSGGAATWGSITGTITNQSDLITYTENLLYPLVQITGVTAGNYPRVSASASNPLEERTPSQVLSDIGAQAADSDLTAIAALSPTNDDIIQRKAGAWTNRTVAEYKVDLGISGTMTGGGVLATGGYTLTVPATGTAALLAVANVFTAAQMVDGTADAIQLRVQGHSTQTSIFQTWEHSGGNVIAAVTMLDTDSGRINIYKSGGIVGSWYPSGSTVRFQSASGYDLTFLNHGAELMRGTSLGYLGIGVSSSVGGKVDINQSSTTAAVPTLKLTQADVSEEFIRFVGTSANATLTQSIVEAADVGVATLAGYVKVYVQDDGNQLTDQAYFMPVYTLA